MNPSSGTLPLLWSSTGQVSLQNQLHPSPCCSHHPGHCTTSHTRPPPVQGWPGLTSSQSRAGTHRRLGMGFPPPRSPGGSCKSCFLALRHLLGQKSPSANPQHLETVVTQVKRTLKRLSFAIVPLETFPNIALPTFGG